MTADPRLEVAFGQPSVTINPGMVRDMFLQDDLQQTVNKVASLAAEIFTCEAAVMTVDHGQITTGAGTNDFAERAGELQVQYAEGPSVDAIVERRHSVADDLRVESRWRFWAPHAARLGWRSLVSVSLNDQNVMGAVNLYSRRPQAFQAKDLATAEEFAQHAALALAVATQQGQLRLAVEGRTLIGQAQGVLMQRYQIDADQAFKVMRRYSSHNNRKLRSVAEDVVRHRQLPTP
jgi:transcriptional regulator with GAF, ATPase, and Fis domain